MRVKRLLILLISLVVSGLSTAQEYESMVNGRDTIYYNYLPVEQQKFKTSFSIAPLYTPATNFAIAASVDGVYSTKHSENSKLSVAAMASIKGMYSVDVSNTNSFCEGKHRLAVSASALSMPTKFWGIGYEAAVQNSAIDYKRDRYSAKVEYLYKVVKGLFIGSQIGADYARYKEDSGVMSTLLPDEAKSELIATTISLVVKYDTRDSECNPQKGVNLSVRPFVRPSLLSTTDQASFGVEASVAGYQKLWKGATIAAELYTLLGSQYTPWQFYAKVGDSFRMRGYYQGQFTDRNLVTLQAEISQNIWRGIGIAAWVGAGNCFGSFDMFSWKQTLPTYGLGLRWVAKENLVLRFDYGFGAKVGGRIINAPLFSVGRAF